MSSLADWLRVFRTLHERAKKHELKGQDEADYRAGCDELARALIAAQKLTLKPGETPRHVLRVARALQVTIDGKVTNVRATTVELSVAGFSALLAKVPPHDDELVASLRVPGLEKPIQAPVTAGDTKQLGGTVRVSFVFGKLPDEARAQLELLVMDTALAGLAS
jgi:hypothetical protein